jgi:hypothetical protein
MPTMLASIFLDTARADYWLPSVPSEQLRHLLAKRLPAIVQEMIDRPYPELSEKELRAAWTVGGWQWAYPEVEKELRAAGRRFRSVERRKRYEYILRNYVGEVLREVEEFARAYRKRDWERSGTAKWLAELPRREAQERRRSEQELQSRKAARDEAIRLGRIKVAEPPLSRAAQVAMRHAQRLADKQLRAAPAIRAAKRLSKCSIRSALKQILQGVSITILAHVPEEDMRRFTRGLARLSDQDLETLRRKVPKQRKSRVAILSKAITRELASRKSD